jgi:hypothetical protein
MGVKLTSDFGAKCEKCETITTVTIVMGELKKTSIVIIFKGVVTLVQ